MVGLHTAFAFNVIFQENEKHAAVDVGFGCMFDKDAYFH
jgi:hypothetical protein